LLSKTSNLEKAKRKEVKVFTELLYVRICLSLLILDFLPYSISSFIHG